MGKIILSLSQIKQLVEANKYKINPKTQYVARCIDGRYENDPKLPALAISGADAGQLAAIYATANSYGFEVDGEKMFEVLCDVVGGIKNLRFHTDEHGEPEIIMDGCGYVKHKSLNPEDFKVTHEQVAFIKQKAQEAITKGAVQEILKGSHNEGAVLMIKGPYGVYPRYSIGHNEAQVFEFHQGLVDKRNRALSKKLVEEKAVELFEGLDDEYLYEVLSSTTEDHLLEIARRLAKDLPIYAVTFDEKGNFTLEEAGKVE